jgi:hypothetical protein
MGILSAPTSFIRYVCTICGAYCNADNPADVTPKKVAHKLNCLVSPDSGDGGLVIRRKNVTNVTKPLGQQDQSKRGVYNEGGVHVN